MTKSYKEIRKEKEGTNVQIQDACWSGYKQVGMKKKGNRQVPNCVPESVVNALFGKDYIYEVQTENVGDMYKGTLTKAQLAKMKQTWATKKASDLTPSIKNFIKGLDQFTQMDIKHANIKYVSDLIEEFEEGEVELVDNFKDIVEENEMRASVRRNEELKEFSTAQIERLAKAYSVMKDRTISVSNAQKLGKMMDNVPDSSLNAIRKKKIPFLSGLALSRMIQKKIPVTESTYQDESAWEVSGVENEGREELQEARWHIEGTMGYKGIGGQDGFEMVIDAPNEKAAEEKAYDELDKARDKRQIGPGGGGNIEDAEVISVERTSLRLKKPVQTHLYSHKPEGEKELKEVRVYRVSHPSKKPYEIEADDEKEAIKIYKGEVGLKSDSGIRTLFVKDHGEELEEKYGKGEFALYAIRPFMDSGRQRRIGDRVGPTMDYTDAVAKAKRYNVGSSIGTQKRVEIKPLKEADLSKSQIKKVHKQADDLPKKDFIKRYGKDGDSVRYATATNMVKKKLGLGEDKQFIKKGELKMNETYKQRLTSAMEHFSISSLGELNEDDQKTFFTYVDDMKEGLSAAQKKLPPALQKAIAAKMKDKKEVKEDLVGGQKKLDKDKDGDIDGKDFAKLRSMKKEYGMSGNMMASKKSTLSMPIKPASKMKKEEKTKETDLEPNVKKLNAMVKDPHKSHKGNPIDDMNAGYMKSDVKAPVKDGGGADMAKVKDKPVAQEPMKKINAMYKENHRYLQTKPGSLEEAVLKSRGLIKK